MMTHAETGVADAWDVMRTHVIAETGGAAAEVIPARWDL